MSDFMFLKSSDPEWTLYEQVAIAAMDCHCFSVAKVDQNRFAMFFSFSWI